VPTGGDAGYFRVLFTYRVLCTTCGACYVGRNHEGHLLSVHGVKGGRKRGVVEGLAGADLAARMADAMQRPQGAIVTGIHLEYRAKPHTT
jgi:hypothetical protein